MNDDFLTRFRKPPSREFSEALYERIMTKMNTQRSFSFRRMAFAAAVCLVLVAAFAFSPQARAAFEYFVREIGGITYLEPDESAGQPNQPADQNEEVTVPSETLSLDAARAKLPYAFNLPEWTPEGYSTSGSARITYFSDEYTPVEITWMKSQDVGGPIPIILMIGQPVKWVVDLDHLTEVQINGQPAGLTGGGWDADTGTWDTKTSGVNNLTLTWMHDDVMYQLMTPGASVEELIRMAESIP